MRGVLHDFLSVCLTVVATFFAIGKVCEFHSAYELRLAKIEKDAWLVGQCARPEFYKHLSYHSNLCEQVEATARIGAAWHAFNAISTSSVPFVDTLLALAHRAGWGIFAAVAFAFLFFPSLFIYHRRGYQGHGHDAHHHLPLHCKGV
jgi:hypothetical protein